MNEQLKNDKPAYVKYDITFGSILAVALHNKLSIDDSSAILAVSRDIALEFLTGKKKTYDYVVSYDVDGHQVISERTYEQDTRSFWELIDITSENCPLKLVDWSFVHFTIKPQIYMIPDNLVLYVTDKNDPNILHYTIRLKEHTLNDNKTWTISINLDDEFSIYVSDNVTRSK